MRGEAITAGARTVRGEPTSAGPPRALWSSRAPVGVIAAISFLLAVVWSTYVFVVRQLVLIKRDGEEKRISYVR